MNEEIESLNLDTLDVEELEFLIKASEECCCTANSGKCCGTNKP